MSGHCMNWMYQAILSTLNSQNIVDILSNIEEWIMKKIEEQEPGRVQKASPQKKNLKRNTTLCARLLTWSPHKANIDI